jgi:hypothetical protein
MLRFLLLMSKEINQIERRISVISKHLIGSAEPLPQRVETATQINLDKDAIARRRIAVIASHLAPQADVPNVSNATSGEVKNVKEVNHGKQYDNYYSGGDQSIYHKLYGGKIISRDESVLQEIVRQCLPNVQEDQNGQRVLKILDYGCGDGRYLQAILPITKFLKEKSNIKVELIAYDPSGVGLQTFEENTKKLNFIPVEGQCHGYKDINDNHSGNAGYVANILESEENNLRVKFIHGHVFDDHEHIKELIKPVHMTMCMYGVLSHIPMQKDRIQLLTTLGDLTQEKIILTLPSYRILQEQKKTYDYLRQEKHNGILPESLKEKGNVHYTRIEEDKTDGLFKAKSEKDKIVENAYHLYESPNEIRFELAAAKLKGEISAQKILHETTLTEYPYLAKFDELASAATPEVLLPYVAGYYLVTASRPKELKQESFVKKVSQSRTTERAAAL